MQNFELPAKKSELKKLIKSHKHHIECLADMLKIHELQLSVLERALEKLEKKGEKK